MFDRVQTTENWNSHLKKQKKSHELTWDWSANYYTILPICDWVNVRAKWNGSWIGHTTKLWPSILCKVLWYKIFILHNLIFIIDHQQHTIAQSKIQKNPFIKIGGKRGISTIIKDWKLRIALYIHGIVCSQLEISDCFEFWMNEQ